MHLCKCIIGKLAYSPQYPDRLAYTRVSLGGVKHISATKECSMISSAHLHQHSSNSPSAKSDTVIFDTLLSFIEVLFLEPLILICVKLLGSNPSICLDTGYQRPKAIKLHLRPENQNMHKMFFANFCSLYLCRYQ